MAEKKQIQKKLFGGNVVKKRGKKSPKNKLNDLTGSEWTHFLCSVEKTDYPTSGKAGYAHKLRKEHPSPKPPQLMEDIMRFFTKKNQWVLDPFVGVGGTLLGCSLAGRRGIGIELENKYLKIYKKVCDQLALKEQLVASGDSRQIESILKKLGNKKTKIPKQVDLILTDPPYANMMIKKRTANIQESSKGKLSTPFSKNPKDIGNLELNNFLDELKEITESSLRFLKNKKYLIMFIKDMQPKEDHDNMLHADVVRKLSEIECLKFKGYKVWFDHTQMLFPLGYPYAFVANIFHQFILIFRKEE